MNFREIYSCLAIQKRLKWLDSGFRSYMLLWSQRLSQWTQWGTSTWPIVLYGFPMFCNHGPPHGPHRWSQPVHVVMFGAWAWECWRREGIILDCNSAVWATMRWASWPAVFGDCGLILPTPMTIQNGKESKLWLLFLLLLLLLLFFLLLQRGASGVLLILPIDPTLRPSAWIEVVMVYEELAMMMMMMMMMMMDCGLSWHVAPKCTRQLPCFEAAGSFSGCNLSIF